MVIVYFFLALLLLFGVKKQKAGLFYDDYSSLYNMKCLQGFTAICIIIHHFSQRITNNGEIKLPISPFVNSGVYFVGIFFFCSGFGLIKSSIKNPDYVKKFLPKRLFTVYLPFLLINLIYILYNVGNNIHYSGKEWVLYLTGAKLINSNAWFVVLILIFYIVYFLLFRFFNKPLISFIAFFVALGVYLFFSLKSGHGDGTKLFQGEWWYNTVFAFPVGMLWAHFENRLKPFITKYYGKVLVVLITFSLTFITWTNYALTKYSYWAEFRPDTDGFKEKWYCVLIQQPTVILVTLTVIVALMKLKFNNKVLSFLGAFTLEIYLFQALFIDLFFKHFTSSHTILILVILCTVACAIVIGLIRKITTKLIFKNKEKVAVTTK